VAQSTVKLIVDAQNAIRPLQRVNEQTKALSSNTDKLKGRLDKSNRSLKNTGKSAKTASAGVGTLVGALKPLLAALAVIGTARFIFIKTAELETQRKSLEQLTGSLKETNKIIDELQAFGSVTPFTSSELIEQTKRLKAFGFETEELVNTTKRLSDVAGATGADLTGIATAFGQIRAKGKLQQEENLQLLERGVNITDELKKITKLQGDEFESAMRKGEIGADAVNQALINLTSQGGIFAGGATKQADTLNGKLSTLQDTVDTLARTIGEDLSEEIKGVIDIAIDGVKEINKLIDRIAVANKVGRVDLANIAMEARKEARELVKEEFGINFVPVFSNAAKREKELFEIIKKRKIEEALTTKEKKKQNNETTKLTESIKKSKDQAEEIKNKTQGTNDNLSKTNDNLSEGNRLTAIGRQHHEQIVANEIKKINLANKKNQDFEDFIKDQETSNKLLTASINGNTAEVLLQMEINKQVAIHGEHNRQKITDSLKANAALKQQLGEANNLKNIFSDIGTEIKQGIVENLKEAIKGSQSFGDALSNVLDRVGDKILDSGLNTLVDSVGNAVQGKPQTDEGIGGALGSIAGSFLGPVGTVVGGFLGNLLPFADGGRPPVGRASLVGERGPELFVPRSAGTIIPNNAMGGVVNNVSVSVDALGSSVAGDSAASEQLGNTIAAAIQATLIKEKRPGGLLTR
jgi:tape measure domain-containing protein